MKAIFFSLAFLAAVANVRAAEAQPSAKLSQFSLGAYITGPQTTLANTTGKAVIIDAWGIHCGPCLAFLPEMEKIAKRYKDKMVVFGAHSQEGTDSEVKDVVKKNKLTYTITNGVNGPVAIPGLPHVFVFDTSGNLVFSGNPEDKDFDRSLHKATQGASGAATAAGAKPTGLDALKRPGT